MCVITMLLQISDDGNTTTSTLSFMATKADAGRHLSCQAENRDLGTAAIEDDWVLQIQCKLINDGDVSSAHSVHPRGTGDRREREGRGGGGVRARAPDALFSFIQTPRIPRDRF